MARKGPFKDLGWGKLGGNKKRSPKKSPTPNTTYRSSVMSQVKQQADAAAVPKKSVGGNYVGIVLRVDGSGIEARGSSWMTSWYEEILEVPLPETIKCKVRIPALHAAIPEPDKYGCDGSKGIHQLWINMHPTFYASSQDVEEPQCGDAVVVSVPSGDGSGGGDGGGLIMTTIVKRNNNTATPGGACPPAEAFPEETEATADGEQGDAMGGSEVSSLPISPFNLSADCDFECMVEAMAGIMTTPQLCPGRDPFGKLQQCGSPYDKKGIFISRKSFEKIGNGMPLPMPAVLRALWADLGYVVIEILEQTADKDYKADSDSVGIYARFFALAGINVYFSGTPYPGKASKYVEYMTQMAMNFPCKGMVMTPSWGYLSPGNKDKYARQAKYVTDKMMKSAKTHMLQLGFSNPWMPSAEYTVAEVDGEDEGVSIRYKDSFPYACFTNVDWAISQILSRSGRSVVVIDETTGEVNLDSYQGENALKQEDFEGVLSDYYILGFKNIIPAFGVMGTGYEDYRVSAEKGPGRLREEQNFIAAKESPSFIGELDDDGKGPDSIGGLNNKEVKNWDTGWFGKTVPCAPGDTDPRCVEGQTALDKVLEAAAEWAALAGEVPEPSFETIEIPVMEWSDGWADYSIDDEGVISYVSPTSGGDVLVYDNNTSNVFPHGCGSCYDAIMAARPASEYVEQAVDAISTAVSDIFPPVGVDDPPVKGKIQHSVMWWDWLNAEKHIPCWKSSRWDVIRNFHRYSPLAYDRISHGGGETLFGIGTGEFSATIQAANEAIDLWNRVAASNPAMKQVSVEAFMAAARANPALLSFEDASAMESYAQAAAHVASTAATEMGYDAEGSAIGDGADAASDAVDEWTDPDAYYGSDEVEASEDSSTGDTTGTTTGDTTGDTTGTEGDAAAATGESGGGGVGLDAYPPFGYIDFNSPVSGGGSGGWYPAAKFGAAERSPAQITQVVIHATGGQDPTAGGNTFSSGARGASAHYGVNQGGYVFQFVKEKDIAYHAGAVATTADPPNSDRGRRAAVGGQDKYQKGQNSMSIGIEYEGLPKVEANSPGRVYTENGLESLAFLVANICKRNGIGINREQIIGHDEITSTRSDPGTILNAPFPEGISYPYGGVDASGVNHGPEGGEMPSGWKRRQGSYSPNINQESTFPWTRFLGLVTKFFEGAGVPMPPSTSYDTSAPAASTDGGAAPTDSAATAAPSTCVPMTGGPFAAGGGGGAPLSAAQIASMGSMQGKWPSGGSPAFTSDYGPRNPPTTSGGQGSSNHGGIDTVSLSPGSSGNPGTIPIYSIDAGTVTNVRDQSDSAGKYVDVTHANGMCSQYMHLHTLQVTRGQTVTAGQVVGTMGTTGNSSGVHLHFQMWTGASYSSEKVDPASALGLQCNELAKSNSRYGTKCQPGNQNMGPSGPYPGY